ncbi:type II secretory pathway pseudopilin PulG [Ochrobactrum sp. P20RRXII]|nr:hypothetical protein [Ochrobactrum sp. P20RRXII]NIH77390.1 type II secretory pathway pseudopilin PulG [Ochrobactrum sp. P20RRXII]
MTPMLYVLSFMSIVIAAIAVGGFMSWRDRARMQSELKFVRTERQRLQEEEATKAAETVSQDETSVELSDKLSWIVKSPQNVAKYDYEADLIERLTRRKEVQGKIRNIVARHAAENKKPSFVFVRNAIFETEQPLRSVRHHLKGTTAR